MNRFGIFDVAFYDTDANKILHRKSFVVGWLEIQVDLETPNESPDTSGADNVKLTESSVAGCGSAPVCGTDRMQSTGSMGTTCKCKALQ